MKILNIRNLNFFFEFFENSAILPYYFQIPGIPKEYYPTEPIQAKEGQKDIVIVNCIPPYLSLSTKNIKNSFSFYSKSYRLGFAMDFREYDSEQEFLRNQLGKKVYKNLRQDIQRLERNHAIRFEIYFGSIDESKCKSLMETLKGFISVRFKGRISKHVALNRWGFYQDTVYEMILAKKASLFVIYELERPIAISLHYHYKKVLYTAIISFDDSFHKYSLGRQMFVKQITWCYNNNYQLLDMGWGSYDYKLKFTNAVYRYQTHVLYPQKSFGKKLVAFCISWALMFKYYGAILRDRKFKIPESNFHDRWLKDLEIK